jgi:hypothetical protein
MASLDDETISSNSSMGVDVTIQLAELAKQLSSQMGTYLCRRSIDGHVIVKECLCELHYLPS